MKEKRMSIYRCGICDEYKDADKHGCLEHPTDKWECICEDCDNNLIDEKDEE
jgi:hypothetical protein